MNNFQKLATDGYVILPGLLPPDFMAGLVYSSNQTRHPKTRALKTSTAAQFGMTNHARFMLHPEVHELAARSVEDLEPCRGGDLLDPSAVLGA